MYSIDLPPIYIKSKIPDFETYPKLFSTIMYNKKISYII